MENKIREKLSDELLYLYNTGKLYHAYETFGAQIVKGGVQFTVWAPDTRGVRVIGDFNGWDAYAEHAWMEPLGSSGVYTVFIPGAKEGDCYKYDIETDTGEHLIKADPFAFGSELRPKNASVVADLKYKWTDKDWIKKRNSEDRFNSPMNIYEVHLGSWKRHPREDGFYSYRELADTLVPYVKKMGYTHMEILPVMEHPLDASWGYQVTGYYSATARHGLAKDFKYFIDCCHNAGIGVILDWVPGHFCPDAHGLANFNGHMLYENEIHPNWGTYKFDFGRGQVRSFLLSNAMFWLKEFHADGIRVDGVSSMLYLNFGVEDKSKKKFNKYGDEGNLEAIDFLRELNYMVGTYLPGTFTVAEESTAWPLVTRPPESGGLGFHFKWNMGWMNDTLEYMKCDFPWRSGNHNKLTFSMTYAYSENYILPLSHDEVVHGKLSLIGRMPGDLWRKFAGIRLLAMYQLTQPGKKLNFMGHELAEFIEWREYEELEWFLLEYENHSNHQKFIKDLNNFYSEHPALWANDANWDGFRWLDADNNEQTMLSYMRFENGIDKEGEKLIIVLNMGVQAFDEYRIGVPEPGSYKEIFSSDSEKYGGSGRCNKKVVKAEKIPMHGQPYSIAVTVPVVGGTIFRKNPPRSKKAVDDKTKKPASGKKKASK